MKKVWVIVEKDWAEVFRNKMVLATVVLTPLLFVVMGVGTFWTMRAVTSGEIDTEQGNSLPPYMTDLCHDVGEAVCAEIYMGVVYLLMFLMLPVILPVVFAAYSVVGEKTAHTLEPLLATPISTWTLVIGKTLAAVVPGVLATWISVILYYFGVWWFASLEVLTVLMAPEWILLVMVVGPLLSILSVDFAIAISSRVSDPRAAQQLAGLIVMPVLIFITAQLFGVFLLNTQFIVVASLVLIVVDLVGTWFAVAVFDREQVLTRWS